MKLGEAKIEQNVFKSGLNQIRFKSEKQKSTMQNTEMHNAQNKVVKLLDDYSTIPSEAKYKTIHGEEMKILTPKQILERLPIAIVQVKVGNTSDNLLNEIRQIIHSFYRGNKIIKEVKKNNMMNSIQI